MIGNGATNGDLMKAGYAPFGPDGNQVNLHHVLGDEPGPMVELSASTHQKYYKQLHGLLTMELASEMILRPHADMTGSVEITGNREGRISDVNRSPQAHRAKHCCRVGNCCRRTSFAR
ncbi:TPA: HNH/ENDO VII family nuclease [Burkholderia vietnamiensis]|uniref:HNH/ENDO VII family nuclease n=1 Tax=Burkholderia vietnamiensis TaxID=60552 RepID=UPI0009BD9DE5|nr:HNH/ENDO VII family nuclease [Burkholderia vietnamiensis]TPQ45993.1 hypothetical protein C2U71_10285 [Burkholderia ubonensis]HDR9058237.1 HNH/ENDO VII family nuclease [Burkholderia vietnamiensis]HDR9201867.1 HNH/ENDO VII family nuclease [Burkholderia vietnamiensis]HDR9360494.1 HNH/ENDO VII family nuclease [Burkholderia vietnamiensis]